MLILPISANAGIGDNDNRYYVDSELWSQEPYNNFVYLATGFKFFGKFVDVGTCSAQYVAPNLILSAGHCVGGKKAKYKAVNYKNEAFDLVLAYTKYTGEDAKGMNDWAVWLVKDPKFFSDTFFEIETITTQTDFINAGWGWVRILSNDEIRKIFDLIDDNGSLQDMSVEEISNKLDKDMKKIGMEPIYDTKHRLKASRCHSIERVGCDEIKTKEQAKYEEYNDLFVDFFLCIPQECEDKLAESCDSCYYNIRYYDPYENCIPEDCRNMLIRAKNLAAEYDVLKRESLDCDYGFGNARSYPYVIQTTCYNWQGNSGGGYVSEKGVLYGTCSFGVDNFDIDKRSDYMASSLQFQSKIKELREYYSTSNTAEENLSKIPKNKGVIKTNNNSNERMLKTVGLNESEETEEEQEEEYTEEEMAERIATLQKELSKDETELVDLLKKSKDFGLSRKLQLLNRLTSHTVKSDRVAELQQKYEEAKANEQSLANKILGAAAIGASGIGGMMLASGLSEQQSDADAERAMRAYLATFTCKYGDKRVNGGAVDVELPGGNELVGLYSEYVTLANDLKVRKAALGIKPGIESESILDSATSGLYDDISVGKTSGVYTSLSRALSDPNGADAAAWVAQKEESSKKVTTGATVGGVGAAGGAIGNLIINRDTLQGNKQDKVSDRKSTKKKDKN